MQFDNVKNVLKAYEDSEGSALDIIKKQFLLTEPLARYGGFFMICSSFKNVNIFSCQ